MMGQQTGGQERLFGDSRPTSDSYLANAGGGHLIHLSFYYWLSLNGAP